MISLMCIRLLYSSENVINRAVRLDIGVKQVPTQHGLCSSSVCMHGNRDANAVNVPLRAFVMRTRVMSRPKACVTEFACVGQGIALRPTDLSRSTWSFGRDAKSIPPDILSSRHKQSSSWAMNALALSKVYRRPTMISRHSRHVSASGSHTCTSKAFGKTA
eukprot:4118873-Pleurochrysis_carterae.AAC.2